MLYINEREQPKTTQNNMDNFCKQNERNQTKRVYIVWFHISKTKTKATQFDVRVWVFLEDEVSTWKRGMKKLLRVMETFCFLTWEHVTGISSTCESWSRCIIIICADFCMFAIVALLLYAQQWTETGRADKRSIVQCLIRILTAQIRRGA